MDPSNATMAHVFEAQRDTMLRWRRSTAADRIARIRKLHDAVLDFRPRIREAGFKDFRKPPEEVDLTEVVPFIAEARDAMRNLGKWMKPKHVMPTRLMLGSSGWVQYEPKGRCLIISPWNYPLNVTLGPLVSCLAAGNPAILKPSEMTPHLSTLMAQLIGEVFPPEEVALFEGEASVSTQLLGLPFDHIFFTGSPAIGKVVMAAAAKHLASVTLELGGKSPTIVDADADVAKAAQTTVWGKFTNNGQTCIAPDHVFVHASIKDAFVNACAEALDAAYGESAEAQRASLSLARVVNQRHAQRVADLLEDAKSHGARVLYGGESRPAECYIQPTLLEGMPPAAKIHDAEIFGPLLPLIEFDDLGKVIDQINAQPKPLALYYWGRRRANMDRVLSSTSAGGTCINSCVVQYSHGHLPFGGVNNSGIGNAHGHFGFKAFSHERAVVRTRILGVKMFFPPYGRLTRRILDFLLRVL